MSGWTAVEPQPIWAGRLITGYSRGCICGQVITADAEADLGRAWCKHQIKHYEPPLAA